MFNPCVNFDKMEWESPVAGMRQKILKAGKRTLRLVEFSDNFCEPEWCQKGHRGYILEGRMTVDFSGTEVAFQRGDGVMIPPGTEHKHKARIAPGEKVMLVLCEEEGEWL